MTVPARTLLLLSLGLGACSTTEFVLTVEADPATLDGGRFVRLTACGAAGEVLETRDGVETELPLVQSFVPSGDVSRLFSARADLLDHDLVPLAIVRAIGGFVDGETLEHEMRFDASCLGVLGCDSISTCRQGRCVSAAAPPVAPGDVRLADVMPCGLPSAVALYRFDYSASATTIRDYSGNDLVAECAPATCPTPGPAPETVSFDGVDDLFVVTDDPLLHPTTAVSVAAWIFVTTEPDVPSTIVSKGADGPGDTYELYVEGGSQTIVSFAVKTTDGETVVRSPIALRLSTWTSIVGVFDGANLLVYGDGVRLATERAAAETLVADSTDLFIGGNHNEDLDPTVSLYFSGDISDLRVYDEALTEEQVRELWRTGPL